MTKHIYRVACFFTTIAVQIQQFTLQPLILITSDNKWLTIKTKQVLGLVTQEVSFYSISNTQVQPTYKQ